jgi:hypothetical protein
MSRWMAELLLFVFATHLPYFVWRYYQTRELRFAATSVTFSLLVISYAIRVFAPELAWGGRPLHAQLRIAAWCAAVVSVALLVRHAAARLDARR